MKKLEAFWFRYFSYATLNNDADNWVRYVIAIIMLIPAIIGIILDVIGHNGIIPILIFTGLLTAFAALWIVIWFYHNWRIRHQ